MRKGEKKKVKTDVILVDQEAPELLTLEKSTQLETITIPPVETAKETIVVGNIEPTKELKVVSVPITEETTSVFAPVQKPLPKYGTEGLKEQQMSTIEVDTKPFSPKKGAAERAREALKNKIESKENLTSEESVFSMKSEEKVVQVQKEDTAPVFENLTKKEKSIYQITYYPDEEQEVRYYSEAAPTFEEEFGVDKVVLKDCFKRYQLEENILGKRIIKVSYRGAEPVSRISVDLRMGVALKIVKEAPWMRTLKDKAEKVFTNAVLERYREFSKGMNPNEEVEIETF